MNQADDAEDELSCSFCKHKFRDIIKLIPECSNHICGRCYENLKEDVDEASKEYNCVACGERHTLPLSGLRDNKALMAAIRKINSTEKRMHSNVKKLRELVSKVEEKMEMLRTFDEKEIIKSYCEKIELEASEAVEKAIKHLQEIEMKMMKQISEFRERCLENLSERTLEPENTSNQELTDLGKEVSAFNAGWNNYLTRIEAFESESDIEAALGKTEEYMSALELMEDRMRRKALNWEKMVLHVNSLFLDEWNHVGEIEIMNEASELKEITIQETPSFTLTGHSEPVRQVLFLPDGRLASCSDDNTIKIWNVENGRELFQLRGHTDNVHSIALMPNGHLASGSLDRTIKIWNLEQRKDIRSIQAHSNYVVSLRVLKNGNLASYSYDDTIKIWDSNSKENEPVSTMREHGNTIWKVQLFGISFNGYLVTCSRHKKNETECILRVWNPNQLNPVKLIPTGFNDAWSLLVLSNNQVALGFDSGTIKIIDLDDDALSRTKEKAHDLWVSSLSQLSNGKLVSSGVDDSNLTIKMWNLLDWSLLQTINTDHSHWIRSLSISGDERFLASGSNDTTIKLWRISIE